MTDKELTVHRLKVKDASCSLKQAEISVGAAAAQALNKTTVPSRREVVQQRREGGVPECAHGHRAVGKGSKLYIRNHMEKSRRSGAERPGLESRYSLAAGPPVKHRRPLISLSSPRTQEEYQRPLLLCYWEVPTRERTGRLFINCQLLHKQELLLLLLEFSETTSILS